MENFPELMLTLFSRWPLTCLRPCHSQLGLGLEGVGLPPSTGLGGSLGTAAASLPSSSGGLRGPVTTGPYHLRTLSGMTPQAPLVSFHLGLLCGSWRGLSLAPLLPSSVPAAVPCHKSHFPFILSIFAAKAQEQACLPSHPHSLLPGSYVYRPKWITILGGKKKANLPKVFNS